jgi:sterol desaturase/sphingolipid hydroxylase (fatty acid hydroxylase superfamily)
MGILLYFVTDIELPFVVIQVIGIKSNFSQPFFVHWDLLMGTRMTRQDIELRRQKKAEKTI